MKQVLEHTQATIRFKTGMQYFNTIREDIGKHILQQEPEDGAYVQADIETYISEIDFYKCFLYLRSGLAKAAYEQEDEIDRSLTPVNIDYMAHIMAKDMDYTMPAKSKNSIQQSLAEEMDRTAKSAYSAINRLRKAEYLEVTEDNLIVPNQELQKLRQVTKEHLRKLGCFPVCYMLNFIVGKDNEKTKSTLRQDNKGDS